MSIELMLFCLQVLHRECVVEDPSDDSPIEAVINAADYHEVPLELALAVATQESKLNCDALSRSGARGILQVMPKTAEWLGYEPERLHECAYGASVGMKYLRMQLDSCNDDVSCALIKYNCGPNCRNANNNETVQYKRNIKRMLGE